jgi:hypothetical protein
MTEKYIPNARDQIIAYFGRNEAGNLRMYCTPCRSKHPLTDEHKVWGDRYVSTGDIDRADEGDRCDVCGITLAELSIDAQAQHDDQQERFRRCPITHVIEMGMVGAIRCRVY